MKKEHVVAFHKSRSLVQVHVYLGKSVAYMCLGKEMCVGVYACGRRMGDETSLLLQEVTSHYFINHATPWQALF